MRTPFAYQADPNQLAVLLRLPLGVCLLLVLTGCGIHDFAGTVARGQAGAHRTTQNNTTQNSVTQNSTTPKPPPDPLPLLQKFVAPGANVGALTANLRPSPADLHAIFSPQLASALEQAYAPLWNSGQPLVTPVPNQTQVRLRASATTDEIIGWTGAAQQLPGGYRQLGQNLKPGFTMHCFEFFTPGESRELAFTGLVYVNDHWVLCPTPWNALPAAAALGYSQSTRPQPTNTSVAPAPNSPQPEMVRVAPYTLAPAPYYTPPPYTTSTPSDEYLRLRMMEHERRMEESRRRSEEIRRAHEERMQAIRRGYRP